MLSSTRLTKEGVEGVVSSANGFVGGHLAIRLNAMLQTVELPAGVANLHSSLPNMNRDALTLAGGERNGIRSINICIKSTCTAHNNFSILLDKVSQTILLHVLYSIRMEQMKFLNTGPVLAKDAVTVSVRKLHMCRARTWSRHGNQRRAARAEVSHDVSTIVAAAARRCARYGSQRGGVYACIIHRVYGAA